MKIHLIILFSLLSFLSFGQEQTTHSLPKVFKYWDFHVAPDGKIFYFRVSDACYQQFEDSIWYCKKVRLPDVHFSRKETVNFITNDTWIAYLTDGFDGYTLKPIEIWRTDNRGDTWEKIKLGYTTLKSFQGIEGLSITQNGQIWISGHNQRLYYSNDTGKNWQTVFLPEHHNFEKHKVTMLNDSCGILFSNTAIIFTQDKFKTFSKIPTPFDQKLTTENLIYHVHIYDEQIIVETRDKYFTVTLGDTIWQPFFQHQFAGLKLDKVTHRLYGIDKDLNFVQFSKDLKSFSKYNSAKSLKIKYFDWHVSNGIIYASKNHKSFYQITQDTIRSKENYLLAIDKYPIPNYTCEINNELFGFNLFFNGMYLFKHYKWYRIKEDYFNQSRDLIRESTIGVPYSDKPKTQPLTAGNSILLHAYHQYHYLEKTNTNLLYFDTQSMSYVEPKIFQNIYIIDIDTFENRLFAFGFYKKANSKLAYSDDTLNWHLLYEWEGEFLSDIFIKSKDSIYIKSKYGSVQLLIWNEENLVVHPLVTYDENDTVTTFPSNHFPERFYFRNDTLGFITGSGLSTHSRVRYKTIDGGKTWTIRNLSKIQSIQVALKDFGYDIEITNVLDKQTRAALVQFQKDNNLPVGRLDIETIKALDVW